MNDPNPHREEEANLSKLDRPGIADEAGRVAVRRARQEAQIAGRDSDRRATAGKIDMWTQIVLLGVVVLCVVLAATVLLFGLFQGVPTYVKIGVTVLGTIGSGALILIRRLWHGHGE